ncbi:MAG: hypothetical protein QGH33_05470, partial [Pirellulaceae bacterium]|nr:hypothetical protein [Pirellulaceae bacterium]
IKVSFILVRQRASSQGAYGRRRSDESSNVDVGSTVLLTFSLVLARDPPSLLGASDVSESTFGVADAVGQHGCANYVVG